MGYVLRIPASVGMTKRGAGEAPAGGLGVSPDSVSSPEIGGLGVEDGLL